MFSDLVTKVVNILIFVKILMKNQVTLIASKKSSWPISLWLKHLKSVIHLNFGCKFWTNFSDVTIGRKFWTSILAVNFGHQILTNERPGNWSCDLRANKKPKNKRMGNGHTDTRTLRLIDWYKQWKVQRGCLENLSQGRSQR